MLAIDLSGRRALVTGGARGIGGGITQALAAAGACVTYTHLGTAEDLEAAARQAALVKECGGRALGLVAPAEDMDAMSRAAGEAAAWMGGIDIVVANVGLNWVTPVELLDRETWQHGLDLNLTTAFIAVKVALPWMMEAGRGDVVFIGSSAAMDGGGGSVHYPAAKAGLQGLMAGLMRELPRKKIRVNTVHPCVVDTDLLRQRYDTPEKRARLAEQVPVGRLSTPADVGNLVAFVCSDLGSFICGQSILVDGGRTLWRLA